MASSSARPVRASPVLDSSRTFIVNSSLEIVLFWYCFARSCNMGLEESSELDARSCTFEGSSSLAGASAGIMGVLLRTRVASIASSINLWDSIFL